MEVEMHGNQERKVVSRRSTDKVCYRKQMLTHRSHDGYLVQDGCSVLLSISSWQGIQVSRAVADPSREALGSHPLYGIHGSASDEKKFKSRERRLNWPVFVPDMSSFHPSVSEVTLNGESMLALHCSLDVIQGLRVYWLKAQMNQTICGSCLSQLCG
ncbi:uncharacterized protein [Diadema antillarum]|uniref:uncharacterized protein isoform X1 n=1 Tax=Diadema antillarum TaxID=105358 RepID=UPI003A893C68